MDSALYFFSYARDDSEFVLKFAQELRDAGANLWVDQMDIAGGRHWDTEIETALNKSQGLILILSPSSVASHNVMDEVSYALEEQKLVVPVIHRKCNVPFRLRRLQQIDLTSNYDKGFIQLLDALNVPKPIAAAQEKPLVKTLEGETPQGASQVGAPPPPSHNIESTPATESQKAASLPPPLKTQSIATSDKPANPAKSSAAKPSQAPSKIASETHGADTTRPPKEKPRILLKNRTITIIALTITLIISVPVFVMLYLFSRQGDPSPSDNDYSSSPAAPPPASSIEDSFTDSHKIIFSEFTQLYEDTLMSTIAFDTESAKKQVMEINKFPTKVKQLLVRAESLPPPTQQELAFCKPLYKKLYEKLESFGELAEKRFTEHFEDSTREPDEEELENARKTTLSAYSTALDKAEDTMIEFLFLYGLSSE